MNTQHTDPHAELKAAWEAGRRIRVRPDGEWRSITGKHPHFQWTLAPEYYEVEPLAADKWAAEKAAHAQGKRIQARPPGSSSWFDLENPSFDSSELDYRIDPDQEPNHQPTEAMSPKMKTDEELGEIGAAAASKKVGGVILCLDDDADCEEPRDAEGRAAFAAAVCEAIFKGVEEMPSAEELHFCFRSCPGTISEAWKCVHDFISVVFAEKTAELKRKLAEAESKLTALSAKLELERQERAAVEKGMAEIAKLPERWRKDQEQRGLGLITVSGFAYELEQALKPTPSAEEIERREFEQAYEEEVTATLSRGQDFDNRVFARDADGQYTNWAVQGAFRMWQKGRAGKEARP